MAEQAGVGASAQVTAKRQQTKTLNAEKETRNHARNPRRNLLFERLP
jgi:hypothetical protein